MQTMSQIEFWAVPAVSSTDFYRHLKLTLNVQYSYFLFVTLGFYPQAQNLDLLQAACISWRRKAVVCPLGAGKKRDDFVNLYVCTAR